MKDDGRNAAVEAAAREMYAYNRVPDDEAWPEWDALIQGGIGQQWQAIGYRDMARRALGEFAPIIEDQVREQIAREIEAQLIRPSLRVDTIRALNRAANIARGVTS